MPISSPTDERRLLLRLRDGDDTAFDAIMKAYKRPLAHRILRILKSTEETEEVLQEVFVRLWIHRDKIDAEQSLKGYLFRIASNLIVDTLRKMSRERRFVTLYSMIQDEAYNPIEEQLFRDENRALLNRILEHIPERSRQVFVLCKLEGYSYEEVAERLSISIATVNSHVTRANKYIKQYLHNHTSIWVLLLLNVADFCIV